MKSIKMLMMAALTIMYFFASAQNTTKTKTKSASQKAETVKYTCPMHPNKVSSKAGKCSQCGMNLAKSKKKQMKMEVMKTYTCPMHAGETSDKPDKCSHCGMDLKMTGNTSKTLSCPMHPDVVSNKAGKCSKCGMDLIDKKKTIQIININNSKA